MMRIARTIARAAVGAALAALPLLAPALGGCHIVADGALRDGKQALRFPGAALDGALRDVKVYQRVTPQD